MEVFCIFICVCQAIPLCFIFMLAQLGMNISVFILVCIGFNVLIIRAVGERHTRPYLSVWEVSQGHSFVCSEKCYRSYTPRGGHRVCVLHVVESAVTPGDPTNE